jgi:hypothetical protein
MSVVSVVCCQVEVSATSWSLVQRSATECCVSECDGEASIMRRPWSPRGFCVMEIKERTLSLKQKELMLRAAIKPVICIEAQNPLDYLLLFNRSCLSFCFTALTKDLFNKHK